MHSNLSFLMWPRSPLWLSPLRKQSKISPAGFSHGPQHPIRTTRLQPPAEAHTKQFSMAVGLSGSRARSTEWDPSWQDQPERLAAPDPSWKVLPQITTSTTALGKLFGLVNGYSNNREIKPICKSFIFERKNSTVESVLTASGQRCYFAWAAPHGCIYYYTS